MGRKIAVPPVVPPATPADRRELITDRSTLAGPPERIAEALLGIRERAGVPVEFVARSCFPTLPYDRQIELMQELAEGVAPLI